MANISENDTSKNLTSTLTEESASVQAHLQIMQSVIQRMASNSASCKTWCVTIISAILVVISDKNKPELIFLSFIPCFAFLCLDIYYLAFEKGFRESYNNFIRRLHSGKIEPEDLYSVSPSGNIGKHQRDSAASFSVWGFYGALILLTIIAKEFIIF